MFVKECEKRRCSRRRGVRRLLGHQNRPPGRVEPDVGDLTWSGDRDIVLASDGNGSAEAVPAEFHRYPIASVHHLFRLIGEGQLASSMQLGETFILGGLATPVPARALTQFGGEIGVGDAGVFHCFSRSRQSFADSG